MGAASQLRANYPNVAEEAPHIQCAMGQAECCAILLTGKVSSLEPLPGCPDSSTLGLLRRTGRQRRGCSIRHIIRALAPSQGAFLQHRLWRSGTGSQPLNRTSP